MKSLLTLTRLNLRLKRGFLIGWILPILAIVLVFSIAYYDYYPTLDSRQGVVVGLQNNMGTRAMYGLLHEPGTVGQMTTWEAAMWAGLLGSVMIVLLIVDIHRRREYTGTGDLILSMGVSPRIQWGAATLTGVIVALMLGAGSSGILLALQPAIDELTTEGALAFGATMTLMLVGSMTLAQAVLLFVGTGSALARTALLTVAVSFVVRSIADTQEITWLNWLSPLGWRELIGAYTDNNARNAAIVAVVCAVVIACTGIVEGRREPGSGLLPTRSTTRRTRDIRGPQHLRWRLMRGGVVAWFLVIAATSGFLMPLSGSISDLVAGSDTTGQIFRDLFGGTDVYAAFITYICQMCTIMVTAAGVQQIKSYMAEERARTVDVQRSTGMRRWAPLTHAALVALLTVAGLIVAMHAGGAIGLATQEATLADDYTSLAYATWTLFPAAMLFVGMAVAYVGIVSRGTSWVWAPLAAAAVVTLMGELLQLPEWAIDLSPLSHPQSPDDPNWWITGGLAVAALLLTIVGSIGAQRREIR